MPLLAKFAYTQAQNTKAQILKNPHYTIPHRLGPCNVICSGCGVLHYTEEITGAVPKNRLISFSTCCQKDKVTLPYLDKEAPKFPSDLHELFTGNNDGKQLS